MFVLVADSQPGFRKIIARILTEHNIDVQWCNSGAELLEVMTEKSADVFVVSTNLADMDGAALCRRIRDRIEDDCIPIIILSAEEPGLEFSQAFAAGATDIFRGEKIHYFSDYLSNFMAMAQPLDARVMIVDGSTSSQQLLQQSLQGWGLQAVRFSSAQLALKAHLTQPYDIILIDIELEELERGLEFVRDIRQQPKGVGDVSIIAVTACLSDSIRVNFIARGIDRCMLKPLLMPELRSVIKKQIDSRQARHLLEYERKIEVDKNRAKSTFLARMSHELRTSLNAIIGFSNLLIMGHESVHDACDERENEIQNYAGKINSSGKLLLELINEVLDLSQIESGKVAMKIEAISLAGVMEKCQQVMASFAEDHQVQLQFNNRLESAYIRCDVVRLTEVLLNLISNAIKYNRPGGSIEVSTNLTHAGFVRISVADNGIGISPRQARTIFEPFTRAHTHTHEAQGTGIGLSIALQLMELMGGVLGFSSQEGDGSTFWIEIPQSMTGDEPALAELPPANNELTPCRVLYVDDNPVNCLLIEKWFSRQAHSRVSIAGSAREGLQLLAEEIPDIVITDIQMPEEHGYWLLEKIREQPNCKQLPVIALSAMAMDDEVERGKLSGFSAYLTKPFDFPVLVMTLNTVMAEVRRLKARAPSAPFV